MRPDNWQLEEAVMLIDLYFRTQSLSSEQVEEEVKKLSLLLRNRAVLLKKTIDERYRNINGIGMQLESVRYLISNGTAGLDCPSKASESALQLYRTLPETFAQLVNEFNDRYKALSVS